MKASLSSAVSATAAVLTLFSLPGPVTADFGIYYNIEHFSAYADSKGGFPSQTFRSSDIVAPVLQVNSWDRTRLMALPTSSLAPSMATCARAP